MVARGTGKWYPPQAPAGAHRHRRPLRPGERRNRLRRSLQLPKKKGGCLRVGLIIVAVLVVLLVIGGIIGAISGGKDDKTASGTTTTAAPGTPTTAKGSASPPFTDAAAEAGRSDQEANSGALFPGRVDAQSKDRESSVPGAVRMEGRTVVVTAAGFEQSISEFETNGYLKASVTIVNRDPTAQAYNIFDWRLQTPSGTVLSPTFTSGQALGSGDLVTGGVVAGDLYFEVGAQKGDFFLIYKPDPFDANRGIWKVTI